jgi:steroid 5-alpha reductase family enzyme
MSEALATLLFGWAGCLAAGLAFWAWSLARRDAGVADIAWGLFFVGLAVWFRARGPQATPLHLLHLAMVALWGCRLALHIAGRSRGRAEDHRYAAMRAARGRAFWWRSLGTVFWLQATLATLLAAPLFAAQAAATLATAPFAAGALLWVVGFAWEAVADGQLARFRRDPENRGRVLATGLWRWSRHPNYFGEALLWWGYGVLAGAAGAWWTLAAPLAMTWLLLRVSGVTLLEKTIGQRRPEYADYARRTSAFVPWPPRRPGDGESAP